jgi:hypothetical protein
MVEAFWNSAITALYQTLGNVFGFIAALLLYLLFGYLAWGLIWDRIITKAGYKGKAFKWRFLLMLSPLLAPLGEYLPYDARQGFIAVLVGCVYVSLWILALHPWKTNK